MFKTVEINVYKNTIVSGFGAVWPYVFALENKHRLREQATE